jgi:hypothetical protein
VLSGAGTVHLPCALYGHRLALRKSSFRAASPTVESKGRLETPDEAMAVRSFAVWRFEVRECALRDF